MFSKRRYLMGFIVNSRKFLNILLHFSTPFTASEESYRTGHTDVNTQEVLYTQDIVVVYEAL